MQLATVIAQTTLIVEDDHALVKGQHNPCNHRYQDDECKQRKYDIADHKPYRGHSASFTK